MNICMRSLKHSVAALCVLFLSACSITPGMHLNVQNTKQLPLPPTHSPRVLLVPIAHAARVDPGVFLKPAAYRIGSQDILSITVWDHPELTIPAGQYRSAAQSGNVVSTKGNIFYPFVGEVHVAGLTANQARDRLTHRLARYIKNPQISVRVAAFNSQKIQVIGAVNQPKTLPINNRPLSLIDAINAAGGFNALTADARRVFVVRGPSSHPKLFMLNANNPSSLLLGENFYLENQDVVYVATSGMASWQKVLNSIVPMVQTGWYVNQLSK